jgi:protein involved in polysaccharide export with SLBB domain
MWDVVLLADGVTEDADLSQAEIARREAGGDPGVLARSISIPLDSTGLTRIGSGNGAVGAAPMGGGIPDVPLEPYDNILIRRQAGWELQRLVHLTGQIKHPGRYALRSKTERLSDLIERAGGLTEQAYPGGIEFYRSYSAGRRPSNDRPPPITEKQPGNRDTLPRGYTERIGIDLPRVLKDKEFADNVILAGGDSVNIPEYNPIVMVEGAVNSPGAVAYTPGKSLDWYVNAAGGYAQLGDNKRAYVTQPNGKREGVKRRIVFADAVPKPKSGAVVFVPAKIVQDQPSNVTGVIGTVAQLLGALVTIIVVARN